MKVVFGGNLDLSPVLQGSSFGRVQMNTTSEDVPRRIFLDSSALQALQVYGGFLYENEELCPTDRIHRDPRGFMKLEALRSVMLIAERAHFEFALSDNSFAEVERRGDPGYLRWAYDVLMHWLVCLEESHVGERDTLAIAAVDSGSYGYLGAGDRALLRDALYLGCDSFLTMENRLPKNADHLQKTLGIRVMSPIEMWKVLRPWAALFR